MEDIISILKDAQSYIRHSREVICQQAAWIHAECHTSDWESCGEQSCTEARELCDLADALTEPDPKEMVDA